MRSRTLLALLLPLACLGPVPAQDGAPPAAPAPPEPAPQPAPDPGAAPHAPPEAPAEEEGGAGLPDEPNGPNLQIPPWIGGAQKAELEATIAAWKAAYKRYYRAGEAALPDVRAAIERLEAARALDKLCALPDYYLGIARQVTGEHDQAILRLQEAIKRNPKFHEALVELGDAQRWAGKDKDAEASYGRAIELSPEYAHAWYMRGLLRARKLQLDQAKTDIQQALKLAPGKLEYMVAARQLKLATEGPDWKEKFEVETKNYVVRTNVSQEMAQRIADNAELIRRLYESVFPHSKSKRKSPIIVFKDAQEYHKNGGPANAGGHFDPIWKQLYLFQYPKESDTLLVLFHEGFHQFLDGVVDVTIPQWFNEGLADYFGPSEHVKEKNEEGMRVRPNPWRLETVQQMLRNDQQVPWEKLLNMTQAEMYQKDAIGRHYAQAWSIVYFLAEADDRAHFHYLKDYFQALRKGKSQAEAWKAAFGRTDMAGLEARWKEFMLKVKG